MTTYTPGALRAARLMTGHPDGTVYLQGEGEAKGWTTAPDIAAIISRETGDAGLLEALKELLEATDLCPAREMTSAEVKKLADAQWKAQAAIAQAQPESVRLPGGKES